MRRAAGMGEGGIHLGPIYFVSQVGVTAKCNLDLLNERLPNTPHPQGRPSSAPKEKIKNRKKNIFFKEKKGTLLLEFALRAELLRLGSFSEPQHAEAANMNDASMFHGSRAYVAAAGSRT